ncbi:unnamed protein product [Schistosoma curassoni]|uniref:Uncharacterized protein n=1 Tax=Schistosoma curassoni TaxID=6186 RepID=A0A183JTZ2_9TREM|nr:unnamed protein product [Schistosoma curassoni]
MMHVFVIQCLKQSLHSQNLVALLLLLYVQSVVYVYVQLLVYQHVI